ncbi:MAG: carboxypeptidase-like regulatory domain-containing protein [Candidatus Eisenbacteria bacterium]|nr:carboxypeptidase-like regulatory domain-containing protein [Candidatus Eisenbacteria bacterium]
MKMLTLALAASTVLAAHAPDLEASPCALRGVVVFEETGKPIPFVNVVLVGTSFGSSTDAHGQFEICDLSPGEYTLRTLSIGHRDLIRQVDIASGAATTIELALAHSGMSLEDASAESVGVDVNVASSDFELTVVPAFADARAGDRLEFDVSLTNHSTESVLVGDLSGRTAFVRCPVQKLEVTGPPGGVRAGMVDTNGCDGVRLVTLSVGQTLTNTLSLQGTCLVPGTYEVTFTYSALSSDVRDWICLNDQQVGEWLRGAIRRAAKIELASSAEFSVRE